MFPPVAFFCIDSGHDRFGGGTKITVINDVPALTGIGLTKAKTPSEDAGANVAVK